MKTKYIFLLLTLATAIVSAQKIDYSTVLIPDSLKQNANAVIRMSQTDINIGSQHSMTIKSKIVVTVFNEKGLRAIQVSEHYDKRSSVRNMEAAVYNDSGIEIKKIKRKDFKDQSAVDGGTLYSDDRVIFLDYTPTQYPFTFEYESEVNTSNTAFIPTWMPLRDYYVSVQKCLLNVTCPQNLGFKKKEFHFSGFNVQKTTDSGTQLSYQVTNIPAQKYEFMSPDFADIYPKVIMGLDWFQLEGIEGNATTWKEFGKWFSDKILTGTTTLPEATKAKVRLLVGDEKDPIKKAKIIYNYVQQKSRYISIQEGIGGWRPMLAADVDRLGYGDCKALSNYTKALLEAVDVPAYYTRLHGDRDKRSLEPDFVSMQFNHVILAVPNGSDYLFLECTSQEDPFGYQANFTDDRNVLVLKPDGGEVVRTKIYSNKVNSQISNGNYSLSETGRLSGKIAIVSEGSQYDKYHIEAMSPTDKEAHYKQYWSNISNLKIQKETFANDKDKVSFTENIEITADNYGNFSGGRMMFVVNSFNPFSGNIKKIRNRKTPFEISRGSFDEDEIAVALPKGFTVESLPKDFQLDGKFGQYKTEIVKKDAENLIYKRTLFLKEGLYANTEYDDFRLFMEQISRNDNAKIVLIKNQ